MNFWFKKKKLNNPIERLTPEMIASFDTVWKAARRQGLEPQQLMKRAGVSDDVIALATKVYNDHIEPRMNQELDPLIHGKLANVDCKKVKMKEEIGPVDKQRFTERKNLNGGMKRSGIFWGVIAMVAWITFITIFTHGFAGEIYPLGWLIFFVGVPLSFAIGFLIIWAVDRMNRGFRELNVGMKRLGIVMGVLAVVAWIALVTTLTEGFDQIHEMGWIIFMLGIPVFFAIGFLIIWVVDWVIAGFRQNNR